MLSLNFCPLFKGLTDAEILALLADRFVLKTYRPGELVALQSSLYEQLLIVNKGFVRGEMTDSNGRSSLIEEIHAPRIIAPAFLYATENRLPVELIAAVSTEIVCIGRSPFTSMMQQDARVLTNYLQLMADRSRFLSEKLRMQRFGTIKDKLARYLLELSQRLNGDEFVIPHTQQQLADLFGVTRPALARAVGQLEAEGLLRTKGKHFSILDRNRLKQI